MSVRFNIWLLCFVAFFSQFAEAQNKIELNEVDSLNNVRFSDFKDKSDSEPVLLKADTIKPFKPDPVQAIWLGAIIPGYGQILNRKYWKLPIVYAGFLACSYAIGWNAKRYTNYKDAYLDITDADASTNSYLYLIPDGYTIQSYGGETAFTGLLKTGMDKSRYYRDLSVIVSVAYYGLTLIDAFVDAHLYDFDISTDLSMNIRPVIIRDNYFVNQSSPVFAYGIGGRFKF